MDIGYQNFTSNKFKINAIFINFLIIKLNKIAPILDQRAEIKN